MPNTKTKLIEALNKSAQWLNKCNELVDSTSLVSNDRTRVAAALFHLSLEHSGSIHLLCVNQHFGSAFALLRPQFEAHIRGVWYQRVATDEQLQAFIGDNEPPRINAMLNDIERIPDFSNKALSSFKEQVWSVLCGFTHGGYSQVSWRLTAEEITVDFEEAHLVSLIETSCALSLQSYVALSVLADSGELATALMNNHQEIFGYEGWHNNSSNLTGAENAPSS
ncbi:MAG: hypothetical protein AMS22_07890 [Thiotrichales bacterium SG8_50]|jgi:hypothetical protein|nr:MAG: hypothetical protein AMS22_07890 [Thiotrichales bacterium SG8_50]